MKTWLIAATLGGAALCGAANTWGQSLGTPPAAIEEDPSGLRAKLQAEGLGPAPVPLPETKSAEQWRFRWYNDQWWYWLPEGRWVYYRDGQWNDYNPKTYRAPYYARSSYRNYDPTYGSSYYGSTSIGGPLSRSTYRNYYRTYPYGYGYGTGYRGYYPYYGSAYRGFPYYGSYYRSYPYQGSYYRDYPYYPGGYFGSYYPSGAYYPGASTYGSAYRGYFREHGAWNGADLNRAVRSNLRQR